MRYDSLKRQSVKSFKIKGLNGGINVKDAPEAIADNQVCISKNMWYKASRFQTRPGFLGDSKKAIDIKIHDIDGMYDYKVTDTEIFIDGEYYKIAVANIIEEDYAHHTYVYLIDSQNTIRQIGNMSFFRIASDVFSIPTNILFFNGKPQNGGGIYAFATLTNQHDYSEKYYNIYEVSADFKTWDRVYDYYVPTIFINGRGNKYQIAKKENGLSYPAQKELESQNMLNGRFNVYYTSDGYSNSFKLPFTNLAEEKVVCRIYYTLVDYMEWEFAATSTVCKKAFMGKEVSGILDREKGVLYFITDQGNFPIPIIDMYHENNIKITASKEIEKGLEKIVFSTCATRMNSKLLLSGGMEGNIVFSADYENPLYFSVGSSVRIGESDNNVTALLQQNENVLAFKQHSLYELKLKEGGNINEIALLSDCDRVFKKLDSFTVEEISKNIGCNNKNTLCDCGNTIVWQGTDNKIYSYSGGKYIYYISDKIDSVIPKFDYKDSFSVGGDDMYILFTNREIYVFLLKDLNKITVYRWDCPECAMVKSGYFHNGIFKFLCSGERDTLIYIAELNGETDAFVHYDKDGNITQIPMPIKNSVITKFYRLSDLPKLKNVENIYFLLAAKGKVKIGINGLTIANINFGFSNEIYDKREYKTVKLSPHLYETDSVYLTLSSDQHMSIGEIEILYRLIG